MPSTLHIQTVRFDGDGAALVRMVQSVAAAVTELRRRQPHWAVRLAVGDAGTAEDPDARLDDTVVDQLRTVAGDARIELDVDPFGANLGHGAGQNRLAARRAATADGDVLVVANPDTYLTPTCLTTLLEVLGDDTVGMAEARQIPLEHPKPFDLATGDTPWASGCLAALPAAVFDRLGGFDPAFFLHGDDVDLSWRVRLSGRRVVHVPQAAVFHDKRPGPSGFPDPTAEEELQGMLARLLLAHRAERPDVLDFWTAWCAEHGSDRHNQGLGEFGRRRQAGELPATYRAALGVSAEAVAAVATFVGGEYAQHRF